MGSPVVTGSSWNQLAVMHGSHRRSRAEGVRDESGRGVAGGVGEGQRADPRQGEGHEQGERRARRRAAPPAGHAGREGVRVRGPRRQGDRPRPVRGPPAALRLQLHVRAESGRRLRRLLDGRRPAHPSGPPARPGHQLRPRLARSGREAGAVQEADGLGSALVLVGRRHLRRRSRTVAGRPATGRVPGRRDVRAERVLPGRLRHLPDLLHELARGRGDGAGVELPRPVAARPAGNLGGLAGGLAADTAIRLVAPPRRVRGGLMSERDGYQPGVPCWVETWHDDPEPAIRFYSGVLGWEAENTLPPDADGTFHICRLRGRDAAGIGSPIPEGAPPTPVWTTFIQVDSADQTAEKVNGAGGSVIAEPFESLEGGRLAIVADPAGATFAVWEQAEHKGAQVINEPGAWAMSGLETTDPEGAKAFYGDVFGWESEAFGPPKA